MKRAIALLCVGIVAGCKMLPPPRQSSIEPQIQAQIENATESTRKEASTRAFDEALLPPLRMAMPETRRQPIEPRFDLSVSDAPAAQVFMSLVADTRYSMLVHPKVSGTISVRLKDVTLREALNSLREIYGYEYRIQGNRVHIQPGGLRALVFQVNYLPGERGGKSEVRVQSGAVSDVTGAQQTGSTTTSTITPGGSSRALESSHVKTTQKADFWSDLRIAITAIVGTGAGRAVVVTPSSGVVVVRAFPNELRSVDQYLRATRLAVERQVMLEAKIVEVELSESYQSGVNWAAFRNSGPDVVAGQVSNPSVTQFGARGQPIQSGATRIDATGKTITSLSGLASLATGLAAGPAGAVFGLALQTSNFAALLAFLETQGTTQVLSSPRLATLNSQKAVLKVGTDEFFVTNVSSTTTTTLASTQSFPNITLQPFFSGVALDVTPQIDEDGNIILHVHPSVTEVTESTRTIDLGNQFSTIRLPLAKSRVNETDTVVRVQDGNIVAIGGLMNVAIKDDRGGLPGVKDGGVSGLLLRDTAVLRKKRELVILIKPTIIQSDRDWREGLRQTQEGFERLYPPAPELEKPQ